MLKVLHARKRFGSVLAVDDVTFEVVRGQIYGLVGPNGAGKTTTMRLILGICDLDGGTITWDAQPVASIERHRLAYVPEERGLYPRMVVDDQLQLFGALGGRDPAARRAASAHWIKRLELEPYRRRRGNELSKGNARKVQLAIALLNDPELVVLDEPFEGLDPVNVRLVKGVLRERVAAGTTFILSSHTMDFIEDLCDGIALIDHGRTVVAGSLDEVRERSNRRVLRVRFSGARAEVYERFERATGLAAGHCLPDDGRAYDLSSHGDPEADPGRLLDAARAIGSVVFFSFGPPSLEEVYVELVNAASR